MALEQKCASASDKYKLFVTPQVLSIKDNARESEAWKLIAGVRGVKGKRLNNETLSHEALNFPTKCNLNSWADKPVCF